MNKGTSQWNKDTNTKKCSKEQAQLFCCACSCMLFCQQGGNYSGEVTVVIIGEVGEGGQIYGLVITAGAVIITDVDHIFVLQTLLFAVKVQRMGFVMRLGGKVKGGRAAHKDHIIMEDFADILIEGSALAAVGIKGKLVSLERLGAQQGEGQTAGGVVFHIVATEFGVAVFLPQHGDPPLYRFPVAGVDFVPKDIQSLGFGIILAVL